jgi:GGDEF domain-containing protein
MAYKKIEPRQNGKWLRMLAFPPTILVPVIMAAMLTRGGSSVAVADLSIPLLASQTFIYFALSFAYLTFHKNGQLNAAWSAAILADGLLLVLISAQTGAGTAFGWGGVALIALGLILATSQLGPSPVARFSKNLTDLMPETVGKPEIKLLVSAIAFPTAFLETDEGGDERIVAVNDAFAVTLGRSANKLEGVRFADIVPPGIKSRGLVFAGAEWISHRTTRGKQTLFMLSPAVKPPPKEEEGQASSEFAIVDTESGLYTPYYMKHKAESDVQTCRRYKRQLAVILFHVDFESKNIIPPSEEAKKAAFAAFARMVVASTRDCDSAYRVSENDVVVFLLDTSQQGAKIVLSRLLNNRKKVGNIQVPELGAAHITDAMLNFFGEELMSLDQVMNELYIKMERNRR